MNRIPLFLFLIVFCGSLFLISCEKTDPESRQQRKKSPLTTRTKFVKPQPVSQGYVGSEACRQCHAEIMKEYESHPMSRSMSVTSNYPVEQYPTPDPVDGGRGTQWTATQSDNQIVHREITVDGEGQEVVAHQEEIDFTCGSGTRGCSYYVFRSGKLFQSPLTWYSQEKKWDLSPGFQLPQHPRFGRSASDGCMACHAGRMNPVPGERNKFDPSKPFHEMSIGCERCHGPGESHIAFHESSDANKNAQDPIVNPENLGPEQREAVCYQCHLQGERRVLRYGRSEFDFRPGMYLADIWITFLKSGKTSGGEAEAVSQVEQMQQSACFTQSKGQLGCISCHDAHSSPSLETKTQFYRDKCLTCHQSDKDATDCGLDLKKRLEKTTEDSCIVCHMPKLSAGDVAHTAQTNHRVHIPGKKIEISGDESDEPLRVWTDKQVPNSALQRAKAIAIGNSAWQREDMTLADLALEGLPSFHPPAKDDIELRETLAQLFLTKHDSDEAFRIWNELLEMFPRDESLLSQVSLVLHEVGKYNEAYPYYKRLEKINNSSPIILRRYLDVCSRLNKPTEAARIAKRLVQLQPNSKSAHQWLAEYYQQSGNTVQAEHHRKIAERLLLQ